MKTFDLTKLVNTKPICLLATNTFETAWMYADLAPHLTNEKLAVDYLEVIKKPYDLPPAEQSSHHHTIATALLQEAVRRGIVDEIEGLR